MTADSLLLRAREAAAADGEHSAATAAAFIAGEFDDGPIVQAALRALSSDQIEKPLSEMLQRDTAKLREAGCDMAEAAIRVIRTYDGIHRLSLAVAGWLTALANQGDRDRRLSR